MPYIDCKSIANRIEAETRSIIKEAYHLHPPRLVVAIPTEDKSAEIYARSILSSAKRVGIQVVIDRWYQHYSKITRELVQKYRPNADGVVVLSDSSDLYWVRDTIPAELNIEGDDHNDDIDLLFCTARACVEVIESIQSLEGLDVVVVGYGKRVGKPLSYLLMRKHVGSVTTTHKYTRSLSSHTQRSDIIISAVGKPGIITPDMVKPNAIVIDVGCSPEGNGDVLSTVSEFAHVTPVPGGIGPVTTSILLRNVSISYKHKLKDFSEIT